VQNTISGLRLAIGAAKFLIHNQEDEHTKSKKNERRDKMIVVTHFH
jgi:hypothetical protein